MQAAIISLLERFGQLPIAPRLISLLALLAVTGLLDYLTGAETSLSLVYLVPIFLASWAINLRAGLIFALSSACVLTLVQWLAGQIYSSTWNLLWNSAAILGIYAVIAGLAAGLREQLEQAHRLSRTDALTGAWNRRALYHSIATELARAGRDGQPFSLVYLDVDDFKEVNDRLGHAAGDRVLKAIAQVCAHTLRVSDLTARVGGDEFALLLPGTDEAALRELLPRLRAALQAGVRLQGVTFSMGALICLEPPSCVDTTLRLADGLMYQAKHGGKNAMHYAVHPTALPAGLEFQPDP